MPYDPDTKECVLVKRGNAVRSAKNCISPPGGLLEHGESFYDGIVRELNEEIGLLPEFCGVARFHRLYKNDNADGYDWVIGVWSVSVKHLLSCVWNAEPDKHDFLITCPMREDNCGISRLSILHGRELFDDEKVFAPNVEQVIQVVAAELLE